MGARARRARGGGALTRDQRKHARQRAVGRNSYRWRFVTRPAVLVRDRFRCLTCGRHRDELEPNECLSVHLKKGCDPDHRCAEPGDCETHCCTCHGRLERLQLGVTCV